MKKSILKKAITLTSATLLSMTAIFSGFGCGGGGQPEGQLKDAQTNIRQFVATMDEVGREIKVGEYAEKDYHVGLFYHVWHGDFGVDDGATPSQNLLMDNIYNIQHMLDTNNSDLFSATKNLTKFHYWNEPLYGYYLPSDEWVLTRHVELFTMADIDYLCVDATNTAGNKKDGSGEFNTRLFEKPVKTLLSVLAKYKDQGFDVPGVMFYTNTGSLSTVTGLYNAFYTKEEYADLWFAPNGKPMIVGITRKNYNGTDQEGVNPNDNNYKQVIRDETLLEFFDLKDSKWPGTENKVDKQTNAMPWMAWDYPQAVFSPSKGAERDGYIAVPVAQHGHSGYATSASAEGPMTSRGYNNKTGEVDSDWREGQSFQQMFDTVHGMYKDKVKTVMVTGWNEWIAQKQEPLPALYMGKPAQNTSGVHFVDVYNNEHSRDIEMMKGGYGDNYYLQLMYNVRKLKLKNIEATKFPTATIDFANGDLSKFDGAIAEYCDFEGDTLERNCWDATGKTIKYEDKSGRNDISTIKVTNDDNYYYFYVKTVNDITDYNGTDTNWMNILIGTQYGNNTLGGFNYMINRAPDGNTTSVHKYNNGTWSHVGDADLIVDGNVMAVRIPMSLLNRSATQRSIRFKVCDNVKNQNDIMDYYVTGDSAPIGRLGFVYGC